MGAYEPLVAFLTQDVPQGFTAEEIALAKRSIIDCTAAMITGMKAEPMPALLTIPQKGAKENSILAYGQCYGVADAALYNGIASHILDLDDTSPLMMGHPSVLVLPAVYALGERLGSSGKEIIDAYLAGVEIACKLAACYVAYIHAAGWHATGVLGSIAAACACGVLLGFDGKQFRNAIGAAASLSCGLRANFGTSTKALHVGVACQNGVLTALMVQRGLTASINALDGREGFLPLFTGVPYQEAHTRKLRQVLARPYAVSEPGFTLKAYPSCSSNHRALGAFLEILSQHAVCPAEVERIEAYLAVGALRELVTPDPKTAAEARFSPGFHFALVLLGIPINQAAFDVAIIRDPRVQKIIKATQLIHNPEFDGLPNLGTGPSRVKVILKDGTSYEGYCQYPLGHIRNDFTKQQLQQKFFDCCVPVIGTAKTTQLYKALSALELAPSIRDVIAATL